MKERFLYPDNNATPMGMCDGYRDYRLAEVLKHYGYTIAEEGCEPLLVRSNHDHELVGKIIIMIVHLSGGRCIILAPHKYFVKNSLQPLYHLSEDGKDIVCMTDRYEDLRIRYFMQDGVIERPVWVSTKIRRKYIEHDGNGKDISIYRSIEVVPGVEPIPYCTDIIEGDLIEPDLVIRDDIVKRLMRSPYIDNAE